MMTAVVLLAALLTLIVVEVESCDYTNYVSLSWSDSQGTLITSPNYPSEYNSNDHVCWEVYTDDSYVYVNVENFATEATYDELTLYDGVSSFSSSLGSLSGTQYGSNVYMSSGPDMYLEFISDSSVQDSGFQACLCPAALAYSCYCDYSDPYSGGNGGNGGNGYNGGSSLYYLPYYIYIVIGFVVFIVIMGIVIGVVCGMKQSKISKRRVGNTTAVSMAMTTNNQRGVPAMTGAPYYGPQQPPQVQAYPPQGQQYPPQAQAYPPQQPGYAGEMPPAYPGTSGPMSTRSPAAPDQKEMYPPVQPAIPAAATYDPAYPPPPAPVVD